MAAEDSVHLHSALRSDAEPAQQRDGVRWREAVESELSEQRAIPC
jgi:hypothetical protein